MGTSNSSSFPSFAGGAPGGAGGLASSPLLSGLPPEMKAKLSKMGGGQDPNKWGLPSLKDVPKASDIPGAGFNVAQDPAAKQALLAQMIARARTGGVTPPAPPAPAAAPAAPGAPGTQMQLPPVRGTVIT